MTFRFFYIALIFSVTLQLKAQSVINASDYCEFLNAVASSDPQNLYDEKMENDLAGACVTRAGAPGNFSYSALQGKENDPINFVSWFDEVQYCNWKNNSSSTSTNNFNSRVDFSTLADQELKSNQMIFQTIDSSMTTSPTETSSGGEASVLTEIEKALAIVAIIEGVAMTENENPREGSNNPGTSSNEMPTIHETKTTETMNSLRSTGNNELPILIEKGDGRATPTGTDSSGERVEWLPSSSDNTIQLAVEKSTAQFAHNTTSTESTVTLAPKVPVSQLDFTLMEEIKGVDKSKVIAWVEANQKGDTQKQEAILDGIIQDIDNLRKGSGLVALNESGGLELARNSFKAKLAIRTAQARGEIVAPSLSLSSESSVDAGVISSYSNSSSTSNSSSSSSVSSSSLHSSSSTSTSSALAPEQDVKKIAELQNRIDDLTTQANSLTRTFVNRLLWASVDVNSPVIQKQRSTLLAAISVLEDAKTSLVTDPQKADWLEKLATIRKEQATCLGEVYPATNKEAAENAIMWNKIVGDDTRIQPIFHVYSSWLKDRNLNQYSFFELGATFSVPAKKLIAQLEIYRRAAQYVIDKINNPGEDSPHFESYELATTLININSQRSYLAAKYGDEFTNGIPKEITSNYKLCLDQLHMFIEKRDASFVPPQELLSALECYEHFIKNYYPGMQSEMLERYQNALDRYNDAIQNRSLELDLARWFLDQDVDPSLIHYADSQQRMEQYNQQAEESFRQAKEIDPSQDTYILK